MSSFASRRTPLSARRGKLHFATRLRFGDGIRRWLSVFVLVPFVAYGTLGHDARENPTPAKVAAESVESPPVGSVLDTLVRVDVLRGNEPSASCLGVVVLPGVAATAKHCLRNALDIFASSWNRGVAVQSRVIAEDETQDLSILSTPPDWPAARLAASTFGGKTAWAIRRAVGMQTPSGAGLARLVAVKVIGIDVALMTNSTAEAPCLGDSGGPLFSSGGEVHGILSRGSLECESSNSKNLYVSATQILAVLRDGHQIRPLP